jgi:pimeloyl-ACP methyl ester carboxylesterase
MSRGDIVAIAVGIATALSVGSPRALEDTSTRAFHAVVTGSGQPVLLIPGLSTTGDVWDGTVEHLQGRYQLHVLTLAGFGGPAALGEPFLPRVAEALVEYARMNELNRPILVGHSLGGFLAFAAAARAPGVFGGVVAVDGVPFAAALGNPAATADGQRSQANQLKAMYASLTSEQLVAQSRRALGAMITDPAHVERAAAWAGQSDPKAVGIAMAEMLTTDLRVQARAIGAPVLLIGALGAAPDAMRPAFRAAYEAQLAGVPHATVVFAERARHFVMLDDPSFLFDTLDRFLPSVRPSGR